ncbi:hypothetical protein ACGY7B_31925 [Burkholderia pseudomallei]|nr:hypothetical protein [Burkholderia pseudomallei]
MRALIFFIMALWSGMSISSIPNCRDMDERTYEKLLPRAIEFFIKSNKFPLGKVDMSPGLDCGAKLYINFEAKPEYNNPGYHWTVEINKQDGRMSIINGI